jgi:tetratricopeptide (TPR) repeat protein
MLFDLRGGGRRRTVQIVYVTLALLMGGGLVLFGIGGAVSGGLVDAITQNGGSGPTGVQRYRDKVRAAEAAVKAHPRDPAAWAALARARYQLASAGDYFDASTGQFNADGKRVLLASTQAWEKHLQLAKNKPDDSLASVMVQAYSALGDLSKAVQAQEVVTEARPTAATFARLAILAYGAGQTRKGDLAEKKALQESPPDQRNTLKAQIDEAKASSAAPSATPSATAAPTSTATPKPKK